MNSQFAVNNCHLEIPNAENDNGRHSKIRYVDATSATWHQSAVNSLVSLFMTGIPFYRVLGCCTEVTATMGAAAQYSVCIRCVTWRSIPDDVHVVQTGV